MRREPLLHGSLLLSGLAAVAALLLIAVFITREAWLALHEVGISRLLGDHGWFPAPDAGEGQFNLWPMLAGSVLVAVAAVMLAAPLGLAAVLFLHGLARPWQAAVLRRLLELLAGIPSVVYGLWGLLVLVPWIQAWQPPGTSLLAGALVLALMILPTVALFADSALRQQPPALRSAAAALGFTPWRTAISVLLPSSTRGVAAGVLLASGRALGETLAMVMVCGNIVQVPTSLFDPVRTLTANIALEMAYAMEAQRSALFAGGLLLLLLVAGLSLGARRAGGLSHA